MVYRRSRRISRRRYRYRPRRRYPKRVRKVSRRRSKKVHLFKRTTLTYTTVYNYMQYAGVDFKLNQLPNYTEFTNLFDQYKICMVKLTVTFNHNAAEVCKTVGPLPPNDTTVYQSIPILHWATDSDDVTAITGLDQLVQFDNYRKMPMNRPIKIVIRPCVAAMAYRGVASTGYGPKRMYIDCDQPDVPHYGWKYAIDGGYGRVTDGVADAPIGRICIQSTYYIACKDVR